MGMSTTKHMIYTERGFDAGRVDNILLHRLCHDLRTHGQHAYVISFQTSKHDDIGVCASGRFCAMARSSMCAITYDAVFKTPGLTRSCSCSMVRKGIVDISPHSDATRNGLLPR